MVRFSILRRAIDNLPQDVMRHMGNVGGRWLTGGACNEIAADPSISTDATEGVFWLQVNHGNTAHFRFAYTMHPSPGDIFGGTLMQVENVLTRAIVWKRSP